MTSGASLPLPLPLSLPPQQTPPRAAALLPPERRSSSAAWMEGVLAMFEAEGLDVPALLRDARIDRAALQREHTRIPVDEVSQLWQLAVARAGRPTLGLNRELAATCARLGTVGHALSCSPDLRTGLASLSRYMPVISDATTFSMGAGPGGNWLSMGHIGHSLPVPRQRIEYAILTVLTLCQWLTRRPLCPLAAEFAHPAPADARPHDEAFGCEVRFDAPANRILLSDADLDTPLPTRHEALGAMHTRLLEEELAQLGQNSVARQVCAEIARRLEQGEPRRQDVAAGLGLAERTLQRRLQEESVSFQALLDRTRRELARQYLAEPRHTLQDVADLLGFVDASNFFRACKRWFGLPPARYRAQLSGGRGAPAVLAN